MNEASAFQELLDTLRWRWKFVLLVAIPLFLGVVLYAEALPSEYEGEAIVTIAPRSTLESISPSQVTVGAPKYVSYITAPSTIRTLARPLGIDPDELEDAVDASLAADTGDITITATVQSPTQAVEIADALAEALVSFSRTDDLLRAKIVAPASVPTDPAGPPRRLIEASGLLLGLLLGVVGGFLVERSRPRVRTWRDIAILTGYPVVGRLPVSRPVRSGPDQAFRDAVLGASVRSLRTNIEREMGREPAGTVLITSAVPGEGKTAVSMVFATALARLDYRVLLIDADLHRATLSRSFAAVQNAGLAGLLHGTETQLQTRLHPGWTAGLTVLPTVVDKEPGELLARNFANVLDQVKGLFDIIVVDSPPILGADDTSTMATLTDGVLFVVSTGSMARPVSEATLALRSLRVKVWGVVANRLPRTGPDGITSYSYAYTGG